MDGTVARRSKKQVRFFLIWLLNASYNTLPFFAAKNALLRMLGCQIARDAIIHSPVRLFTYAGGLSVGRNSVVCPHCFVDNRGGVTIGANVNISHCVKIYTAGHDIASADMRYTEAPVVIGDDVWIFPNALIMPGVTIGAGSIIYPGALVTRDTPEFSLVAGVPARVIGSRNPGINYVVDHRYWFAF